MAGLHQLGGNQLVVGAINSGPEAQALQIFDTWGGSLSAAGYREFSLHYMQRVIARLPTEADGRKVPVIVFTKGGGQWLNAIANCGTLARCDHHRGC